MLLTDRDIFAVIADGQVVIDPFDEDLVQPASVDVRLADGFRVWPDYQLAVIDPLNLDVDTTLVRASSGGFILHPGQFALASTVEEVRLSRGYAARIEGKSTLGRCGLMVHSTAGWVDPGFTGTLTLELSNVNTAPIRLTPGMLIGQLCLFQCTRPAAAGYAGRYQGQAGPCPPRPPR